MTEPGTERTPVIGAGLGGPTRADALVRAGIRAGFRAGFRAGIDGPAYEVTR